LGVGHQTIKGKMEGRYIAKAHSMAVDLILSWVYFKQHISMSHLEILVQGGQIEATQMISGLWFNL
jgi:hypothetical protein